MNPIVIRVPIGAKFRMEGCLVNGPYTLQIQQPDGSWWEIRSTPASTEKQGKRTERIEVALEDFRDHGCRHDLNPTLVGIGIPGGVLESPGGGGWHAYLKSMDRSVRMRAAKALEE